LRQKTWGQGIEVRGPRGMLPPVVLECEDNSNGM
jgi:hypothetical protein